MAAIRVSPAGGVVVEIPHEIVREAIGMKDLVPRPQLTELATLEQMSMRYVAHVLACCDNNKSRAAKVLGIDRRSLYRILEKISAANAEQVG